MNSTKEIRKSERFLSGKRIVLFLYLFFFLLGLAFRCFHILYYSIQSRDSYVYFDEIVELQEKRKSDEPINNPRLAIVLMSIPSTCFGIDILKGGVIINMIFGELIIILAMKVCYNIFRTPIALLFCGIIASSNSNLIYYSTQMLRENSFFFFVCAAIELLTRRKKDNLFRTFVLGILTLCAALCRFEGLEIIIIYTVFKIIEFVFDKHKTKKKLRNMIVNGLFFFCAIITSFSVACFFYRDIVKLQVLGIRITHFLNQLVDV